MHLPRLHLLTLHFLILNRQVMHMPGVQKHPDDSGHDSGTHKPETAERCWGRQVGVSVPVDNKGLFFCATIINLSDTRKAERILSLALTSDSCMTP